MSRTVFILDELMTALAAPSPAQMQELADLGVAADTKYFVGVTKIRPSGSLYEPDSNGMSAWIVPCMDGARTADLLAFTTDPEQWWLRRGGCPFLGGDALDRLWLDDSLHIHRMPINWLQAGAQPNAIVVLDWRQAAAQLLAVPSIIGDDYEHALEIEQHLKATQTIPNISFPAEARTAA